MITDRAWRISPSQRLSTWTAPATAQVHFTTVTPDNNRETARFPVCGTVCEPAGRVPGARRQAVRDGAR
jgi:hypothetical protein